MIRLLSFITFVGLLFSGQNAVSQVRIVCMGNSITQGKINPGNDSVTELSYRPWLWKKLEMAGINVDMVGYNNRFFLEDSIHVAPSPFNVEGKEFDRDNEAYYGITSESFVYGSSSIGWTGKPLPSLQERMNDPARGYKADIALLHIGTNDKDSVVGRTIENISSVIDLLRKKNPQVVVFAARLITGWKAINKHIDSLAKAKNTKHSPVIVVDLATGFINDPKNPNSFTFDWVHPNERGQQFMADHWFNAIMHYLNTHKRKFEKSWK